MGFGRDALLHQRRCGGGAGVRAELLGASCPNATTGRRAVFYFAITQLCGLAARSKESGLTAQVPEGGRPFFEHDCLAIRCRALVLRSPQFLSAYPPLAT